MLDKSISVSGERGDGLVSGREHDPVGQIEAVGRIDQSGDGRLFVVHIRNPNRSEREPGAAADRRLVVDDADGDPLPSEAAHDSESLIVAADNYDPARLFLVR